MGRSHHQEEQRGRERRPAEWAGTAAYFALCLARHLCMARLYCCSASVAISAAVFACLLFYGLSCPLPPPTRPCGCCPEIGRWDRQPTGTGLCDVMCIYIDTLRLKRTPSDTAVSNGAGTNRAHSRQPAEP